MKTSQVLDIAKELGALQSGSTVSWGRISRLLREIERTGYWSAEADSFTRWVNSNAHFFGCKPSTLWRIHSSGRYYERFKSEYPQVCVWDLAELPGDVSPENLELTYKLWRVAPQEIFLPLLEKVVGRTVKRSELRSAWVSFRPMLGGKTARGTRGEPDKVDDSIDANAEQVSEALIAHRLETGSPEWTCVKELVLYRVYPARDQRELSGLDAVAVTRGRMSRLMFHGIEISTKITYPMAKKVESSMKKCDLMWVALPSVPSSDDLSRLPELVGVIAVDACEDQVVRPARLSQFARDTGELAKKLLERELRS